MKEETSAEIKKCIDEAERELREKFSELIFDCGDNDGQYFLTSCTTGRPDSTRCWSTRGSGRRPRRPRKAEGDRRYALEELGL